MRMLPKRSLLANTHTRNFKLPVVTTSAGKIVLKDVIHELANYSHVDSYIITYLKREPLAHTGIDQLHPHGFQRNWNLSSAPPYPNAAFLYKHLCN